MKEFLCSLSSWWSELISNDFNYAYMLGVGTALVVIITILLLKILTVLFFRTRRCREITVGAADGDVMIAGTAIESAVNAVLADFPALDLRDFKLYRSGKRYILSLVCNFDATNKANFPEEIKTLKTAIFTCMKDLFGVENVRQIRIRLEKLAIEPGGNSGPTAERNEPVEAIKFAPSVEETVNYGGKC